MTREERRAAAKKRKEAAIARQKAKVAAPGDLPTSSEDEDSDDSDTPANPNHTAKARTQAANPRTPVNPDEVKDGKKKAVPADLSTLSRREREALQAQQSRERYQKLHAEGKTDEARADLARLALIKQKRAEDAARKQAEADEKAEQAAEKNETTERERRLREAALGTGGKASKGGKGGKKK